MKDMIGKKKNDSKRDRIIAVPQTHKQNGWMCGNIN